MTDKQKQTVWYNRYCSLMPHYAKRVRRLRENGHNPYSDSEVRRMLNLLASLSDRCTALGKGMLRRQVLSNLQLGGAL